MGDMLHFVPCRNIFSSVDVATLLTVIKELVGMAIVCITSSTVEIMAPLSGMVSGSDTELARNVSEAVYSFTMSMMFGWLDVR